MLGGQNDKTENQEMQSNAKKEKQIPPRTKSKKGFWVRSSDSTTRE
jgi:hypothetical protein